MIVCVLDFCFGTLMGNSRDDYYPFSFIYNKNKVGYLHRQPTSNVSSNNTYYEKQRIIIE